MPISWVSPPLIARAEAFSEVENWDLIQPPTADVKLRVPWSQRHEVAAAVMGMQWPYYTAAPLYGVHTKISAQPQSKQINDGDGNVYETAFVDVHFDPFAALTESIKTNGEMLKINRIGFKGGEDPQFFIVAWDNGEDSEGRYDMVKAEEAPTKIIVGFDYEVNFERLDSVPPEALTLVDSVNDDTVTPINIAGIEFAAETLMLMSSEMKHTTSVDGTVKNSLSCKFGWRKNGWNKFWRAQTMSWEYMYVIPIQDSDIPRMSELAPKGFDPDEDGPSPVIYRNFPMADFSALLPTP